MKEKINLKYDAELKKSISEITSISIDEDFDTTNNRVEGIFEVSGTYKSHGLSINQDNFNFKIPFEKDLNDSINEDTINVKINDFNYTIDSNTLCLDINYEITGEIIEDEFDDLEEFNRFLDEHEVDVVEFTNDLEREEIEVVEPKVLDIIEETNEIIETNEVDIKDTIINNIDNEETYITYHIYICNESDTFNSISKKYDIDESTLKEYNDVTELTLGTKLIIPIDNE